MQNKLKTIISFSILTILVIAIEIFNSHAQLPYAAPFNFGVGYIGIIFLIMLFIPNIIWTRFQPIGYIEYSKSENKILGSLEKIGEVGATVLLPFFTNYNFHFYKDDSGIIFPARNLYVILAFALMILYEIYWIRYFRSSHTMKDFYSGILGFPLAGATLPVIALFLLGLYARNPALIPVSIILGIGHIGIHYQHYQEIK